MIKAVIFDMDGTMVESEALHSRAYEQVLREHGHEPVFNELGLVFTPGIKGWGGMVGDYNIGESEKMLTQKKRKVFAELIQEVQPMPGLLKLIKRLKEKKYKLAVATSSIPESAENILRALHLETIFDAACGTRDGQNPKPHPDVYLRAAEAIGVNPTECIAIEDSETGILSAKGAGMKVIAVPSIYTKNHSFDAADRVVKSLNQVTLSLIQSL